MIWLLLLLPLTVAFNIIYCIKLMMYKEYIRRADNAVKMRDDRINELLAELDKEYGEIGVPVYLDPNNAGGLTFDKPIPSLDQN